MQTRIHATGDGRTLDVLGNTFFEKAAGDDLSGGAAVFEQIVPPEAGPPAHVHRETDEFFYVIDGEIDVWVGERHAKLTCGMSATLPRGVPHRFVNRSDRDSRVLVVVTPGTGAHFFDDIDRERPQLPRDRAKLEAIVARHDIEFVEAPAT